MWFNLWPFLVLTWLWLIVCPSAVAQVSWTPIYVNGNNQIDLWTENAAGCPCSWDPSDQSCACCVKDGGCHCGKNSPNRCTQCGLESHCTNMCNVTFQATSLIEKSGKTFGQIKSPSLVGPDFCWYTFVPEPTQRVELQIYRLVSVGKWNGTSCESGHLQLVDGTEPIPSGQDIQICGVNERYTPPVVIFADEGPATLLFLITEKTLRSQFLAYFSFTSINNSQGVGFHPRGGMRLQNTDCDWLYKDVSCQKAGPCVLASPGYPGIYPPNRQCKYHIGTTFMNIRVRISFKVLFLPHNHCSTDYVSIYQGTDTTNPLLTTLCGNRKMELEYSGPDLLIVFSSGFQVPPHNYNGFLATLDFIEATTSTEPSAVSIAANTVEEIAVIEGTASSSSKYGCDITIQGNYSRSGHFDSRTFDWQSNCRIIFKGRLTDIVHITIFNYHLKTQACRSVIEVVDGVRETKRPLKKICSPQTKHARDSSGRFLDPQTFSSSGNVLMLLLRKPPQANEEFVDGAYLFHDEEIGGTFQPNTKCDVTYYGAISPSVGKIDNSAGSQDIYWNVEGPLQCSQQFSPAANQSVTITVQNLDRLSTQPFCQTECGDSGCRCVSRGSLNGTDHLVLIASDREVACLCGDFSPNWLPVSVRSWGPITVRYSVGKYMWNQKGFSYSASYNFNTDSICGHHNFKIHAGEITSKNFTTLGPLNHFYHQICTWTLDSNVERQLEVEISSSQNRPCTAWNISIHTFNPAAEDHNLGNLLHTFCPRERHKTYSLPWKLNTVVVRVKALSRTPPQFKIKWKSQVVRANTRLGAPTPAPNAISLQYRLKPGFLGFYVVMLYVAQSI